MWKHPRAVGKNWFTHLLGAWKMAIIFQVGVFRCLFHGLVPDIDIECAQNTADKVLKATSHDD